MLEPLKQFICDTCGQIIEKSEKGWIEWESSLENNKRVDKNFRICHHKTQCQLLANHRHCSDILLKDVIGEYVHAFMYTHLDIGPYHEPEYRGPSVVDIRQYTDFMRRLTLPFYEEARQFWSEAMADGYFGQVNEMEIYSPSSLKKMIEHYSRKE